mmetsp:Transcript_135088/g.320256  ORF Transcript_135088/g.320256 Transcript_135088/m.320256 type:complete len:224 (-) Transcript_135088:48-719(-)
MSAYSSISRRPIDCPSKDISRNTLGLELSVSFFRAPAASAVRGEAGSMPSCSSRANSCPMKPGFGLTVGRFSLTDSRAFPTEIFSLCIKKETASATLLERPSTQWTNTFPWASPSEIKSRTSSKYCAMSTEPMSSIGTNSLTNGSFLPPSCKYIRPPLERPSTLRLERCFSSNRAGTPSFEGNSVPTESTCLTPKMASCLVWDAASREPMYSFGRISVTSRFI